MHAHTHTYTHSLFSCAPPPPKKKKKKKKERRTRLSSSSFFGHSWTDSTSRSACIGVYCCLKCTQITSWTVCTNHGIQQNPSHRCVVDLYVQLSYSHLQHTANLTFQFILYTIFNCPSLNFTHGNAANVHTAWIHLWYRWSICRFLKKQWVSPAPDS